MKSTILILILTLGSSIFAQPWDPDVIWDRSGATDSAHYGTTVFALGDQNGDSLNDWGVFAFGPVSFQEGGDSAYVELFHGGTPPSNVPYMSFTSHRPVDYINWANGIGDVNGDGYQDWYMDRYVPGQQPPKRVEIYFGGPNADTTMDVEILAYGPDLIRAIGDFNGDGYDDIQIWRNNEEAADIFFGGAIMDTIPDWHSTDLPGAEQSTFAMAMGGDLNHDGYDDWAARDANHNPSIIYVYLGSAVPDTAPSLIWDNLPQVDLLRPLAIISDLNGDQFDELLFNYGYIVFGAETLQPIVGQTIWINSWHEGLPDKGFSLGDINGDGFGDVLMLNPYQGSGCWGEASIHLGASWINPNPFYHFCGGGVEPSDIISPYSAAGLGDVNGDSVPDLLIGGTDPYGWEFVLQRGRAIIIAGDSTLRVSADEPPEIVHEFSVSAYPNPFNGVATVVLDVPMSIREVSLTLYNLLGQVVHQEVLAATSSRIRYQLRADDLPSGVFILHCQANQFQSTTKLMHLK
jgi:hypothetical protein